MAIATIIRANKSRWGWGDTGTLLLLLRMENGAVAVQPSKFLQWLNITLSENLAIPFLGLTQRSENIICTPKLLSEALFTIVKKWNQLQCSSPSEWIDKTWSSLMMQCYLAMERNEVLIHPLAWMNLKTLCCLQKDRVTYHSICMNGPEQGNPEGQEIE